MIISLNRSLPTHLAVVLIAAGIMTATPRMPAVWQYIDPWLFLLFDGELSVVDSAYGLAAVGLVLWMASRLLPVTAWPWRLVFAWLPYGLWALASVAWSRFPGFSFSQWVLGVLIGISALLFGYTVGYSHHIFRRSISFAFGVVFTYLFLRFGIQADQLTQVGFDVVLASFWLATWMPLLICWLSQECEKNTGAALFVGILLLEGLSFLVPQRMYALTLCILILATLFMYDRLRLAPSGNSYWRGYMMGLLLFFGWSYIHLAQSKLSSYIPGKGHMDGAWYRVFTDSERYEIFSYWLRHGVDRLWEGVGLGWQLPAMAYNHLHYREMVLDELAYSHAHNILINTWLQLGLIGLLFYALWLAAVAWRSRVGLPNLSVGEKRWALAVSGMILVLLLRNAADDGMREGNVFLFWFLMGFCLGKKEWLGSSRRSCCNQAYQVEAVPRE